MILRRPASLAAAVALAGAVLLPAAAAAHCDSLDGPVVKAAQEALATGDVNRVLIWVAPADEGAIRQAFDRTRQVRSLSPQAQELADTYFFETLVRIHRAGEGAPYDGLKPAGRDLGPAIPAADQALASGDLGPLVDLLVDGLRSGLTERYQRAMAAKAHADHAVAAGRDYVAAYVTFIHYAEGAYAATAAGAESHGAEGAASHAGH